MGLRIRGLILAGGTGSRLWPITKSVNKHLLPVHDKPMIYYPLSNLMLVGIKEIGIICPENQIEQFRKTVEIVTHLGASITLIPQPNPDGIVDAIRLARDFIGQSPVVVHLGDNFFFGSGLIDSVRRGVQEGRGATIFSYAVNNPTSFGVMEVAGDEIVSIEEKPRVPKGNRAITGLYIFRDDMGKKIEMISRSKRGEFEIVDLLNQFLVEGQLGHEDLPRGSAWLDLGTLKDLGRASAFVETLQSRQGLLVGSPEEAALRNDWIDKSELRESLLNAPSNNYSKVLLSLVEENN